MEAEYVALEEKEKQQWIWIFEQLRDPVHQLRQEMIEGIEYSLYTLEFAKGPAGHAKTDLEANGQGIVVRKKRFATYLENMIQEFLAKREGFLKDWCTFKELDFASLRDGAKPLDHLLHERHHSQLFLMLDVSG